MHIPVVWGYDAYLLGWNAANIIIKATIIFWLIDPLNDLTMNKQKGGALGIITEVAILRTS